MEDLALITGTHRFKNKLFKALFGPYWENLYPLPFFPETDCLRLVNNMYVL